jgi:hypothetical protein
MMKQIKETIALMGGDYSNEDARTLADEVLNFLIERSKAGKGKDGKPFPGYSKAYMNSLDFKIAGKKPGRVDLTLSGEMLDSLKVLIANKNKIVIGYDKGDPVNGKAEGNILGTYGKDKPNPSKARNFMDLSAKELSAIISKLDILPSDTQNSINKQSDIAARNMINNLDFSIEEDESA